MKLVKKIYAFITAAACCAAISGIMPFSSSAEESVKTYGDLSYVTSDSDGDGTYDYIAIIDCNESVTKIEILAEIEDIPVVEIESSAFNGCTSLTSINIPDSVISIGEEAFMACINQKKQTCIGNVIIPDGTTHISSIAFYICSGITSVSIPDSILDIEPYSFSTCKNLEYINIRRSSFADTALKTVEIPRSFIHSLVVLTLKV